MWLPRDRAQVPNGINKSDWLLCFRLSWFHAASINTTKFGGLQSFRLLRLQTPGRRAMDDKSSTSSDPQRGIRPASERQGLR
jgi:hypothetical protein